jgi:ferredoxin/flavodoxin---NADP+ reductase
MTHTQTDRGHLIGLIGAGPAGLYAAKKLVEAGSHVVLFNRDIKPGGLAEYGIFPTKHKMKEGLRKQFRRVLAHPQVDYYGNCSVGEKGELAFADLQKLGFDALICAAGAQGTKSLGLPGEDAVGVVHAKDLVYHYNHLPPFSQRQFPIGRRVAIIGMGNVMIDIAHFLLRLRQDIEEVLVVARRGPAERKYDAKEYKYIEAFVDQDALRQEIARLRPRLEAVEQDVEALMAEMTTVTPPARPADYPGRMLFRFLASPTRVLTDADGRVCGLEVEENILVPRHGDTSARGTGTYVQIPLETVVFAIGDRVDDAIGLPYAHGEFLTNAPADTTKTSGAAYRVYDPVRQKVLAHTYVVGWSRKASDGLVGKAKQDAELGIETVLQDLAAVPAPDAAKVTERRQAIRRLVEERCTYPITKDEVALLEEAERQIAAQAQVEEYKFDSNAAMLEAINSRKASVA